MPPTPWYLVTAGLGARLAHGDPQCGAGRQKPALFAIGGHLLSLPVTHHLYPHALRVLQAEGMGLGRGRAAGREESRSEEAIPRQVGQGASEKDSWGGGKVARALLGLGAPKGPSCTTITCL